MGECSQNICALCAWKLTRWKPHRFGARGFSSLLCRMCKVRNSSCWIVTSSGDPQFASEWGQGCFLYLSLRKHSNVGIRNTTSTLDLEIRNTRNTLDSEIRNTTNTSDLACLLVGTKKNQELEARLGLCCALPEELQDQLIALPLEKVAAREGDWFERLMQPENCSISNPRSLPPCKNTGR